MPNRQGSEEIDSGRSTLSRISISSVLALCLVAGARATAQTTSDASTAQNFQFVSDGPAAQVWGKADDIPRVFFPERLPAFFSKTIRLDAGIPHGVKLNWIFTGRDGGFTVEIGDTQLRVYQRFYDSYGLNDSHTTNPERIVSESSIPVADTIRSATVTLDAHLSLTVLLNGVQVAKQSCMMDVSRHQLQFQGPRSSHIVVGGALLAAPTVDTVLSVDAGHRHQTIFGFGGSPSVANYLALSEEGKKRYWQILSRYNLLVDREYPMGTNLRPDMSNLENPADAKPHYYGDNFPNSELTSFAYNAQAKKMGGKVIYELWGLPAWATQDYTGPDGKVHKGVANPEVWAKAMVTYARMAKEKTGYAPDVIGIQNEVQQPKEISFAMVNTLRRELDAAGFKDVKIEMPDASYVGLGTDVANTLQTDKEVWSKLDIAAAHEYDYQDYFTEPDAFDDPLKKLRAANGDKPFLATEICLNNTRLQIASYRVAFNVGQLYHKNMTLLDATGLLYCWLILDTEQPNFEASRSLLMPDRYHGDVPLASSYQLRVMGAYSRHLHEGMVRVDASSSNADLLVSAYEGEGSAGVHTLIATNRGTTPQTLTVNWPGTAWRAMERVSQYAENVPEAVPAKIVVQPGEIVTLSTEAVPIDAK